MTSSKLFKALTAIFTVMDISMDIQLLKLPHLWKVAVTTAVWHR
jgi:hypothetical protein